ncbi:hypothetical protein O0L34_g18796 [Tuta absoluta]|nr:hypothetical protein O0L34_g18796 [Tuta absoluta]
MDEIKIQNNRIKLSKRKNKMRVVKVLITEYSSNSSIHGLKYIGDRDRTIAEKVFWLSVFLCCTSFCGLMIWRVWWKWYESPLIVSFTESMVPVTEIPFPAMTICPQTKSLQRRFNFTEHYHKLGARRLFNESSADDWTTEERNLYEDVSLLCESYFPAGDGRKFSSGSDILKNLMKVSPNITDIFKPCAYRGRYNITCDTYFSPILTEEGICFTFNSVSANDMFRIENLHDEYLHPEHDITSVSKWTVDHGFEKDDTLNIYPRRGLGAESFSIIFHIDKEDLDYLCLGPLQGFKVILHNPAEFPRASNQFIISQLRHIVRLAVVPRMTMSSDGIDMFDPFRRQCYFQNERYLRFFKVYTQSNCATECIANYTFKYCGCARFGLLYGPEMVVCNAGKVSCIQEAKEKMAIERLEGKLPSEDICECLPACNSLRYKVESYQSEQDWNHYFRTLKNQSDLTGKEHAYLEVFFKDAHFDRWRRLELYGWADILSDCGGLLGLFMGVSVLSLVEILYFLTCR